MKKIILSLLIISLVFPTLIFADNSDTVSYLQSQPQDPWITQALSSANAANINTSYITDTTDLMTAVKNILALSSVQNNNSNTINPYLQIINSNFDGTQIGSNEQLNDDFWALIALKSISQAQNMESIKNFIISHQNTDGGWSWATNGESDTNDTSAAIMALKSAGLNQNSTEITNALNYLQTLQKDDGGFSYSQNGESDGSSTAWVISALNSLEINPSTWTKGTNTPITFLNSLKLNDGSYKWLQTDTNGNLSTTAYALTAISGKYYPVNIVTLNNGSNPNVITANLRIEGPDSTFCLASNIEANNVLELLEHGAQICNIEYIVTNSDFGQYVSSINGIAGSGMNGWQYFVNSQSPIVGANDYILTNGDNVLWAYGGFGIKPTKITTSATNVSQDDVITLTATYFENGAEHALANSQIYVGTNLITTNDNGIATTTIANNSSVSAYVNQTDVYIRSNKVYITSGIGSASTNISLSTNIVSGDGGDDNVIAFTVNTSNINFGNLRAGQSSQRQIVISNTGNSNITIESNISGDNLFTSSTQIEDTPWQDFSINLNQNNSSELDVKLTVPGNFTNTGNKTGELIFWATGR